MAANGAQNEKRSGMAANVPACDAARQAPGQPGGNTQHFGKFRGTVVENIDPTGIGRLLVDVPQFPGMITAWAMPCTPYAGERVGFFALPPIGANVWVEFEGGELNFPVWAGCFWGNALEVPADPPLPTTVMLASALCTLTLNDIPGVGATLTNEPASLRVASELISLSIPESSVSLTETNITVSVPPSELIMGEGQIALATEVVSIEAVVSIIGDTNVEGAVNVTGETTIAGDFNVAGDTNMEGLVTVLGAMTVTGEAIALSAPIVSIIAGEVAIEAGDVNILGEVTSEGIVVAAGFIPPIV